MWVWLDIDGAISASIWIAECDNVLAMASETALIYGYFSLLAQATRDKQSILLFVRDICNAWNEDGQTRNGGQVRSHITIIIIAVVDAVVAEQQPQSHHQEIDVDNFPNILLFAFIQRYNRKITIT